jgi:hypothetical protein
MPEFIAIYDPGQDVTVHATVALTGGRCVGVPSGRNAGGPSGISDTGDGNLRCGLPTLNGPIFGVASYDAPLNGKCTVMRAPKTVPIECSAAVAAGVDLSVDADGRVKTRAAGQTPIGRNDGPATTGAGQYVQATLFLAGASYA